MARRGEARPTTGRRYLPSRPTPSASAATGGKAGLLLGRGSAVSMAAAVARRLRRLRLDETLVKPPSLASASMAAQR